MVKSNIVLWFTKISFLLIINIAFVGGCKSDDDVPPVQGPQFSPDDKPTADNSTPNVTITWEEGAHKLSHDVPYAEYGRIQRIIGDTLLLTYHCGDLNNYWDNIAIRRSIDDGETWSDAEIIVPDDNPDYWGFANPQILVLQDGSLMLAYTGRGKPDDNAHDNIQIRMSSDRGWTFGAPKIVATGRSWEPAMVQYEDGEIQIFYSSEANWWPSDNVQQEILMVRSVDNGVTWKSPKHVAYTSGMRDGMATPLILQNDKGIIFPIESVNNTKSPWIVWSSTDARWNYKSVGTVDNDRRWLATTASIWGGAPYIAQLSTGETILSCQDADGRTIADWKKSTMLVLVGNSIAKNFGNISRPWPNLPTNEGAYYSSLFLKDENTLVLVTTKNFADNHSEIYWKEGHITK